MTLISITTACPSCGSKEIVYSCDPSCCFNHVCSACLSSFELSTVDLGETSPPISMGQVNIDPCAPTVDCARCKSLNVYMTEEAPQRFFCTSCRAVLELVLSSEQFIFQTAYQYLRSHGYHFIFFTASLSVIIGNAIFWSKCQGLFSKHQFEFGKLFEATLFHLSKTISDLEQTGW